MRRAVRSAAAVLVLAAVSSPSAAQVLRFDEIPGAANGRVQVGNFYHGAGGAAFDFGVEFVGAAEAFCLNRVGTPNCSNTSWGGDPGAVARGTERAGLSINAPSVVMNRAAGFTEGFSFYAANPFADAGQFQVWSDVNGTGTLLATRTIGATPNGAGDPSCFGANYCPFVANSVSFAGVGRSVRFTTVQPDFIIYDDITFGSTVPGTVIPEPATTALVGAGLLALAGAARRRRSA
jgi:hypothetical protein